MLDKFNNDASCLKQKKLFLLDMDGTIYNENSIFEGTLDFLRLIEENGGRYVFITNNSSKSVKDYITKVNNMGIPANEDSFFTSAQATALQRMMRGRRGLRSASSIRSSPIIPIAFCKSSVFFIRKCPPSQDNHATPRGCGAASF